MRNLCSHRHAHELDGEDIRDALPFRREITELALNGAETTDLKAYMTRTLEILERLIAFPAVNRDSNLDLIDRVQGLLDDAGFVVTRIWSPDRNKAEFFGRFGPNVDGGICLSAHTDVDPVDGQIWTGPPFCAHP